MGAITSEPPYINLPWYIYKYFNQSNIRNRNKKQRKKGRKSHIAITILGKEINLLPDDRKFSHVITTSIFCVSFLQTLKLMTMSLQHGSFHLNNYQVYTIDRIMYSLKDHI